MGSPFLQRLSCIANRFTSHTHSPPSSCSDWSVVFLKRRSECIMPNCSNCSCGYLFARALITCSSFWVSKYQLSAWNIDYDFDKNWLSQCIALDAPSNHNCMCAGSEVEWLSKRKRERHAHEHLRFLFSALIFCADMLCCGK